MNLLGGLVYHLLDAKRTTEIRSKAIDSIGNLMRKYFRTTTEITKIVFRTKNIFEVTKLDRMVKTPLDISINIFPKRIAKNAK